ncbi:hypothetical protein [Chryseobacterium sp. StRB126]|uniref:hypothetical protein n=1 Tax=Chryseobacterium sp. StRB126 TaxID=878220 RepID=UPI0011874DC1|nr:hypothetical protein [Chryseobacterium sp. StRB126]
MIRMGRYAKIYFRLIGKEHIDEIRKASRVVVGNLTHSEQILLIAILYKLDEFHDSLYRMNQESRNLLDNVYKRLNS